MADDNTNPMMTQPDQDGDDQVLLGNEQDQGTSETEQDDSAALKEQGLVPEELSREEKAEVLSDTEEAGDDAGSSTPADVETPESTDGTE